MSSVDLCQVESAVEDHKQCQVPSRQSLVLEGEQYFLEVSPKYKRKDGAYTCTKERYSGGYMCMFSMSLVILWCFQTDPPLAREDAKSCLYSVVVKVARVLHRLDEEYNVVHLDVRLDLKLPDDVVMIDFDRSKDSEDCGEHPVIRV